MTIGFLFHGWTRPGWLECHLKCTSHPNLVGKDSIPKLSETILLGSILRDLVFGDSTNIHLDSLRGAFRIMVLPKMLVNMGFSAFPLHLKFKKKLPWNHQVVSTFFTRWVSMSWNQRPHTLVPHKRRCCVGTSVGDSIWIATSWMGFPPCEIIYE